MLSYLLHFTLQVIAISDNYIHTDTYFDLLFVFVLVSYFEEFEHMPCYQLVGFQASRWEDLQT